MMNKKTTPYSALRQARLANPAVAAEYLNQALAESQESFLKALFTVAQARQMSKVAKEAGLQRETLYRSLSGQGNPTLVTLDSILGVLDLRLTVEPKGREDAHETSPSPVAGTGRGIFMEEDSGASFISLGTARPFVATTFYWSVPPPMFSCLPAFSSGTNLGSMLPQVEPRQHFFYEDRQERATA